MSSEKKIKFPKKGFHRFCSYRAPRCYPLWDGQFENKSSSALHIAINPNPFQVKKMSSLSLMYVYSLQWFSTLYLYRSQFEPDNIQVSLNMSCNQFSSHSGLSTSAERWCLMHINVCVTSIENSNKSKMLSKRLRYLSDHLTFNCFTQVNTFLLNHCLAFSGESVAVPEAQEDLHLHSLPGHDDLQAAAREQGRWYLDGRGPFSADC